MNHQDHQLQSSSAQKGSATDGSIALLSHIRINQAATVLQLPAIPMDEREVEEQRRIEYVGSRA